MTSHRTLRIAVVAGEASGDILGGGLMAALKARHSSIEFIGVGGPRMEQEGLVSAFPMERLSVMGLVEVLGRLPELLFRRRKLIRSLIQARPDVMIGIDAPDFNLGIELKLRKAGIRTVHYVSPSVWAWRQKRVEKIRRACDLVLALFPFETDFYRQHQVPVRFVGHPLADAIPLQPDRQAARERLSIGVDETVVALMPGSRGGEIERLGGLFFDAAQHLLQQRSGLRFIVPCANTARYRQLEVLLENRSLPVNLLDGQAQDALAACDAVLIASGTATLEAMLFKRPMVVAYRLAPLTYRILRHLVKTPYVALPNLLADQRLVPEWIQDDATPENLADTLLPLLTNGREQTDHFERIHRQLRKDASAQAAEAVLDLLGER